MFYTIKSEFSCQSTSHAKIGTSAMCIQAPSFSLAHTLLMAAEVHPRLALTPTRPSVHGCLSHHASRRAASFRAPVANWLSYFVQPGLESQPLVLTSRKSKPVSCTRYPPYLRLGFWTISLVSIHPHTFPRLEIHGKQ
jgi:hypothetical protein